MGVKITHYAPVIIPTLNRYVHLKRCVDSLAKCTHAPDTELIIGLDYPPSEKYVEGWEKVCDYLPKISGFKKVTILKRESNYGPLQNTLDLMKYVSKDNDRYIYSEDDNEFSPNFLDYINKGLEAYKDNPKVFAICGYNYNEIDMNGYDREYYFSHEMNAFGFGTWVNDRCNEIQDITCRPSYLFDLIKKVSFGNFVKDGTKRCNLLFDIGLDYRGDAYYTYYEWNNDMYCMFPTKSLSRNWGYDGTGIHCDNKSSDRFSSQVIDDRTVFESDFDLPVIYDDIIKKKFSKFQTGTLKKRVQKIILLILMKLFVKIRRY